MRRKIFLQKGLDKPFRKTRSDLPVGQNQSIATRQSKSAFLPIADIAERRCHVRIVPCVDGSGLAREIFKLQAWSVLPCVRPLGAVHMTAGHNALRGSGPGQNRAFDDAMAQVGCPDRRIDRLLHCVLFALPTFTSRRMPGAISFTAQVRRDSYIVHPWPSWPRPSAQSCWQARWRRPWWGGGLTTP